MHLRDAGIVLKVEVQINSTKIRAPKTIEKRIVIYGEVQPEIKLKIFLYEAAYTKSPLNKKQRI